MRSGWRSSRMSAETSTATATRIVISVKTVTFVSGDEFKEGVYFIIPRSLESEDFFYQNHIDSSFGGFFIEDHHFVDRAADAIGLLRPGVLERQDIIVNSFHRRLKVRHYFLSAHDPEDVRRAVYVSRQLTACGRGDKR